MSTRKRKRPQEAAANGPLPKRPKLDDPKKESIKKNRSDSHLFTDDNPDSTVHGTGFNSKEKAEQTISMMHGRDITYQFQVINTMYYRAKSVIKRTKNATKVKCIQEAIDVFEHWLTDYKANNRKTEMFHHLSLDVMTKCEPLADYYQIDKTYLNVYRKLNGDAKMLRITKVPVDILNGVNTNNQNTNTTQITWDIHRNQLLRTLKQEMNQNDGNSTHKNKNEHHQLYCDKHSDIDGLPTLLHTKMIMLGYTPDNKRKLTKALTDAASLHSIQNT
mmetsp:Transcript_40910/g.65742  ORF Transcript_40910/g.65742 Transcript_40910/m.65742 type:complete len:275 (-) Transcript_40910:277-1101(-)